MERLGGRPSGSRRHESAKDFRAGFPFRPDRARTLKKMRFDAGAVGEVTVQFVVAMCARVVPMRGASPVARLPSTVIARSVAGWIAV